MPIWQMLQKQSPKQGKSPSGRFHHSCNVTTNAWDPNALRFEFCHDHIQGKKDFLFLKILSCDDIKLCADPGCVHLQPARKYKKGLPACRHCSKGEKGFTVRRAPPNRKKTKQEGSAKFCNEKTRATASRLAPRDQKTLKDLATNRDGGLLSISQQEATDRLTQPGEPDACRMCKSTLCRQPKCWHLHSFF